MADISKELLAISSGRFGVDIRMEIHDALKKIADEENEENGEENQNA